MGARQATRFAGWGFSGIRLLLRASFPSIAPLREYEDRKIGPACPARLASGIGNWHQPKVEWRRAVASPPPLRTVLESFPSYGSSRSNRCALCGHAAATEQRAK